MLVEGVLCAIRMFSLRVARGVLVGEGCEGDLVCHRLGSGDWASGIPRQAGIWASPFPPSSGFGLRHSLYKRDWASFYSAFPTPLSRGPWHNNEKKLKRTLRGPLVFCIPSSLMQASLRRSASIQKKPSSIA